MWSKTGSDSRCEAKSRAHVGRSSRRSVWLCRRQFNKSSQRPRAGMLRLVPRRLRDRATHGAVRRCYCILSKTSYSKDKFPKGHRYLAASMLRHAETYDEPEETRQDPLGQISKNTERIGDAYRE